MKYAAVQGTLPRQWDIARWNEEQFRQFFTLVNYFVVTDKNGQSVFRTPTEKIKEVEDLVLKAPPSFQTELLYRINLFSTQATENLSRKFYYRLVAIVRTVGNYIRKHPGALSDENRKLIENNTRLNWMTRSYVTHRPKIGGAVVVPDTRDTTTFQTKAAMRPEDPQVKLMNSLVTLADIYETLVKSLTKKDLKALDTKDKFTAIKNLAFLFGNKVKPNSQVFNQVNIYKTGREDLEKSLLEYGQSE